jgi:hypothetical protein
MKLRAKRTKRASKRINKATPTSEPLYGTVPTAEAIFIDKVGKPQENEPASLVGVFLYATKRLLETKRSFSIQDLFQEMASFPADAAQLENLWDLWTSTLESKGRLTRINGCYEWDVWTQP